ncbi:MAG: lamin tail domain-containing protein [Cellulomonadaceae bacterium]
MHPSRNRRPGRGRSALRAVAAGLLASSIALSAAGAAGAAALPARYDVEPGSPVLISEVANGGAGASVTANRNGSKNFIEITNYSGAAVDISGWKIYRCGQTGGGYGPQAVVPDGTELQPGDQFTAAGKSSGYAVDALYDTDLHTFGFGAFIEDASGQRVDAIGFYHEDVATDCALDGQWLERGLQHRLDESHQRVSTTGDIEQDWVVATRTVDGPNRTESTVARADNGLRISEFTNGDATSLANQYVEITNYGDQTVDVGGYQLFRCGENGTQYLQNASLPAKALAPGESYVAARAGANVPAEVVDATYTTSMHWRDFGVIVLTPDNQIVDRVGVFDNRNSPCTDGAPIGEKLNGFDSTVFQRVGDTGDNAADFAVTTDRTPGTEDPATVPTPAPEYTAGPVQISEINAAGTRGASDEFFELANYGTEPVDLTGWSVHRCYGTGQGGIDADAQIADLGVTLAPGQTYVGTHASAPADLLALAQGTYGTGLNETEGFGLYVTDADGALVDAFAAYDVNVNQYTPCRLGQEARNYVKNDQGETYTRAQFTGDNERDFVVTAERTPGVLADATYVDPTVPLPGELDAVSVATNHVPGTPAVAEAAQGVTVTTTDQDGTELQLRATSAPVQDSAGVVVRAGVSAEAVPSTLEIAGEQIVTDRDAPLTAGTATAFPFQRFEIPVAAAPAQFVWSGTASARNELQLLVWDPAASAWAQAEAAVPSADGDVTLVAELPASAVVDGTAHVLVIDGPRTHGGLIDEVGVTDQAFADPGSYDFAINHMSDTQFYAEGFQDVFRQMTTWVVANADARKIAYSSLTGDIIENWINGNNSHERADREFQAAQDIITLLNDANVPNGVLPGNHDNMWGHDNRKYNEYFPVSMFEDKEWYGQAWAPGDNSAHTDYLEHDGVEFLVVSLPYRPSDEQLEWANQQAKAHPEHNVIVAVHAYLNTDGVRDNVDLRYTGTGQALWEKVIAPNDNVFLVFGGHFHGVVTHYADPVTGEQVDAIPAGEDTYAISNVGATGRTVVEMLADYQGYRSTQAEDPTVTRDDMLDRDTGFQRLLQFDLDAGLMGVNAYSPTLDSFEAWQYDEPSFRGDNARYSVRNDEFVVGVDLIRSTTLTARSWAVTGAGSELATASTAPGQGVQVPLTAGEVDQLWFAEVTDTEGNVVRSVPALLAAQVVEPEPEPTDPPAQTPDPTDPPSGGTPDGQTPADGGSTAPAPGASSTDGGSLARTGATVGALLALTVALTLGGAWATRRSRARG